MSPPISHAPGRALRAIRRCRIARSRSPWTGRRSCRSACSPPCATTSRPGGRSIVSRWPSRLDALRGRCRRSGARDQGVRSAGGGVRRASRPRIAAIRRRVGARLAGTREPSLATTCQRDRHSRTRSPRWLTALHRDGAARTVARAAAADVALKDPTMIPLNLHPDRLFLLRSRAAQSRARAVRDGQGPADRQPARPHRSAVVRRQRAVQPTRRHCSSRRITTSSACSTARAWRSRTSAIPRSDGGAGRTGCAQDLAHVRRALPPVSRHADAALARSCLPRGLRHPRARLTPESADRVFDQINDCLRQAGVPSARAVRALQHRSDRDHRIAARSARASREDSRAAAGRAASSPPIGPTRSSIPSSTASPRNVASLGELTRRGHGDLARLSRRASQPPRLLQDHGRDVDRSRPSDRADVRSRHRRMRGAVRQGARRHASRRPRPRLSAARC